MLDTFITTTSVEGLKPLGAPSQRSFELLTMTIQQRLSDEHADLFAEPVSSQHGNKTDWFGPNFSRILPLKDLSDTEQETVKAQLGKLTREIRTDAGKLAESDQPDDLRLAEAMTNAIEVPGEDAIFVSRAEDGSLIPILVNWAWVRDEQKSLRGVLTGMDARPKPAPKPAVLAAAAGAGGVAPLAAVASGGRGWLAWLLLLLGWLLFIVLIGYILYLLLQACGISGQGRLIYCPKPAAVVTYHESEGRVLEADITALERHIAQTDRACQPVPPPAPPVVTPTPAPVIPQRTEMDRRLDDQGGKRGDFTITLIWDSKDDLDLYVKCPTGRIVGPQNLKDCNGQLDIDANGSGNRRRNDPVENVFYNNPIAGEYEIRVHGFAKRGSLKRREFTLQIRFADGTVKQHKSIINWNKKRADRSWRTRISIGTGDQ